MYEIETESISRYFSTKERFNAAKGYLTDYIASVRNVPDDCKSYDKLSKSFHLMALLHASNIFAYGYKWWVRTVVILTMTNAKNGAYCYRKNGDGYRL